MKTWRIPVVWEMKGVVSVEAKTLKEAIVTAKDECSNIPIPENGEYLDGSWEVDCADEEEYLRSCWNAGQEDDE